MPFAGLGGSPVPVAVTERATRLGIKVFRSYGSTEHPSITGCLLDEPEDKRLTTDGRALPGVEIRLDDDGEILSRGPDCCLGYTDPELTATVFDADGWYHTGDVGSARRRRATSPSPTESPTSSSAAARTSAPRRSRSSSSGMDAVAEVGRRRRTRRAARRARGRRGAGRDGHAGADPRAGASTIWPPPGSPVRSGPSRSTRSTTSRGPRPARCRSSGSASSSARGPETPAL